jgi:hypothetical protein
MDAAVRTISGFCSNGGTTSAPGSSGESLRAAERSSPRMKGVRWPTGSDVQLGMADLDLQLQEE